MWTYTYCMPTGLSYENLHIYTCRLECACAQANIHTQKPSRDRCSQIQMVSMDLFYLGVYWISFLSLWRRGNETYSDIKAEIQALIVSVNGRFTAPHYFVFLLRGERFEDQGWDWELGEVGLLKSALHISFVFTTKGSTSFCFENQIRFYLTGSRSTFTLIKMYWGRGKSLKVLY